MDAYQKFLNERISTNHAEIERILGLILSMEPFSLKGNIMDDRNCYMNDVRKLNNELTAYHYCRHQYEEFLSSGEGS